MTGDCSVIILFYLWTSIDILLIIFSLRLYKLRKFSYLCVVYETD